MQMHFGEKDASIPMSDVEIIKQKRGADCEIYVYPDAQHGFHCDERGSYQRSRRQARLAALDGVSGEECEAIRYDRDRSATSPARGGGILTGRKA